MRPQTQSKEKSRSKERAKKYKGVVEANLSKTAKPKTVNNIFDNESEELMMIANKVIKSKDQRKKKRYNPYKDPNFDPNAPQYRNTEFRSHSQSTVAFNASPVSTHLDVHSNTGGLEKIEESLE